MNIDKYFKNYSQSIFDLLENVDTNLISDSVNLIKNVKENNKKIYIIGNGGSSSIASHVSVDFLKAAKIKSATFNNSNLITCFANDYGHDNWVSEAIKAYYDLEDLFIIISSSGSSVNLVNGGKFCNENNINLITLTGFNKNNPLSKLGKVNFHIDSTNYNFIEMVHHIILVSLVDVFTKS